MYSREFVKRLLGSVYGLLPRHGARRVILIYHAIDEGPWGVPPAAFELQLKWLLSYAKVVTLDQLLSSENPGDLTVAITFDDGYESVAKTAAPMLARHGMPAMVYVNPNSLAETSRVKSEVAKGHYPHRQFMTWPELSELVSKGWSAGSHGLDHVDLTRLSSQEVRHQVSHSRDVIAERLKVACDHYCYTWGRHNAVARAEVVRAGYRSAAAGMHGPVTAQADRFALPRIDIRPTLTMSDFAATVRGDWDYLGILQRLRRAIN